MVHRDNVVSSSTAVGPATGVDVPTERATPQPTVLSTVWEGPPDDDSVDDVDDYPRTLDLDGRTVPSRILRWLVAPASRRRALVITTVVAVACGALLAVGEVDESRPELSTAPVDTSIESTRSSLGSRGVGAGDRTPRAVVSADERLRLTATSVETDTAGWMLEAQVVDPTESDTTIRFTVNGAVVEEIDRAPYRLLLDAELLASYPNGIGEGQPLIVTASALWPDGDGGASPASIVLPN